MVRLLAESSVEQRGVLGFPEPGHAYWTRGSLDAVQARLGPFGMDLSPYEEAWARREASPKGTPADATMNQLRAENSELREEIARLRAR